MNTLSKNIINISGHVGTYIVFSKRYHFKIGNNYVLDIPVGKGPDGAVKFKLKGEVTTEDHQVARTEGLVVLGDFMSKLSIFFNVPIKAFHISNTRFERTKGSNHATTEISCVIKGAIAVNDSKIGSFEKVINSDLDKNILSLFRRCRSEDPVLSFWTIYNIMLILIAKKNERKDIDQYLKINYPDLTIVHNDHYNQDNTILIAIRDSFSHKTTYSGKTLDVGSELTKNLDRFRNIARSTILDKLGVVIPTTE